MGILDAILKGVADGLKDLKEDREIRKLQADHREQIRRSDDHKNNTSGSDFRQSHQNTK